MISDKVLEKIDNHMRCFSDFYLNDQTVEKLTNIILPIADCIETGGKIFICGNGGSASDAQHFAAELVGRFEKERRAINAIALTTNTSILTAIGNDYGFEDIFSRQVEAIGKEKDILIGISTSGKSKNIIKAFKVAKEKEILTISLTGNNGGNLKKVSDLNLNVKNKNTATIQEIHIIIIHTIAGIIEDLLC
uniref:D-sedoheptulose-7-phosphate isomerase n=1 Tax=viral metagenome TaxID=1070528 RepID=A0A6M3JCY8_9ZZZZ